MNDKSKKEQITEAAINLFSESGFHSTNVPAIAEQAGVAIGTIYHYFEGKNDILVYIFSREINRRKELIEKLAKGRLSIWDKIEKILDMHFLRAKENRELAKVLIIEVLAPEEGLHRELKRLRDELTDYISQIIKEGIENGMIFPCDPVITAHALVGMIESVTARGVLYDDRKAEEVLDKATQEMTRSIKRWLQIQDKECDNND